MLKTPIATPSPPTATPSSSRHQSPHLKLHSTETLIKKSSDIRSDSPTFQRSSSSSTATTNFQSLVSTTKACAYPEDDSFSTSTPTIDIDAENICDKITANTAHQQFCLRWNNYGRNLTNVFDQLLQNESFVDVTLACDGHSIKAHKMVLSACSPYFQSLFFDNPCQHPIIIMRDVKWMELKAIVEFMYKGEIKVSQAEIGPLLRVAEMLKIRGLTEVNGEQEAKQNRRAASPQQLHTERSSANNTPQLKKSRPNKRLSTEWDDSSRSVHSPIEKSQRQKRSPSIDHQSAESPRLHQTPTPDGGNNFSISTPQSTPNAKRQNSSTSPSSVGHHSSNMQTPIFPLPSQAAIDAIGLSSLNIPSHTDEVEIKPGIAEMIREEERAKLLENSQAWPGVTSTGTLADSYQYQLQSMWQKCWSTNQNLVHHLRFRERGPLKSWRPETMAEAIFSVLKDGLSLSQAARKYDIPYPTFVLYANRVHNMLGPSMDSGLDLRPKGRGRPQRILLGIWPDDHIKSVIKAVVFRDVKDFKDDTGLHLAAAAAAAAAASYGRHSPAYPFHDGAIPGFPTATSSTNGLIPSGSNATDTISSEAAVAMAAVMGLRQQRLNAAAAASNQHHSDTNDLTNFNLSSPQLRTGNKGGLADTIPLPKLGSPATSSPANSNELGFPMPRLASPAIPNIHSIGGLSSLHLMQHNLGGNSDHSMSITNRRRSRSSDTRTPPHSDTTKYSHIDAMSRCEKSQRHGHTIDQSKHLSNNGNKNSSGSSTSHTGNHNINNNNNSSNNNNNTKDIPVSSSNADDSIQDLRINSPAVDKQLNFHIDDFDSVGVDIAINSLPFKTSLQGFLSSTSSADDPPIFTDELNDFEDSQHSPNRSTDGVSYKDDREKIKIEPLTECRGQ